jgi:ABC-type lipoprotein export system ATPase subunit
MGLLEARCVSKSYRGSTDGAVWALREVSLAREPGQITALVGPSGAGKTTLLSLLGAIEQPTRGRILFREQDPARCSGAELAPTRRAIRQIFQLTSAGAGVPEMPGEQVKG